MTARCIKEDPLNWLEVGREYECTRKAYKMHIAGVGMVVSIDIFNEHFEIVEVKIAEEGGKR